MTLKQGVAKRGKTSEKAVKDGSELALRQTWAVDRLVEKQQTGDNLIAKLGRKVIFTGRGRCGNQILVNSHFNVRVIRFQANKEVAQYVEPKRKAVEVTGDAMRPVIIHTIDPNGIRSSERNA